MATTYSLGTTGIAAQNPSQPKVFDVPDASQSGISCNAIGGAAQVMRTGDSLLVKNPDGSQSYYRFDAERSNPALSQYVLLRN
jgi:hypothetical protein